MAIFDPEELGASDDSVTLRLGDDAVHISQSYEIQSAILTQPTAFSLRLGWGDTTAELFKHYSPNTSFVLIIANAQQASGRVDEVSAEGSSGATEVTIKGRDTLASLHDVDVNADISFANSTYVAIVERALKEVGLGDATLVTSNLANRKLRAGVPIAELAPPDLVLELRQVGIVAAGTTQGHVTARSGERWSQFLSRYLEKAGLMLWAAADGSFILSQPNAKQAPAYRIVRRRGQTRNEVNVVGASLKNDTTSRFSKATAYGRGGGKKLGRTKAKGSFTDDEMQAWGFSRTRSFRDTTCTSQVQAEFYARRKVAEARRAGWQLRYTVAGHTTAALGSGRRAVWTPDTMVQVDDDEFGLHGNFYLESVTFKRPPTTTELVLMRPSDLVFGGE